MLKRIEIFIVGLLYWIVFGLGTLVTLITQILGLLVYLFNGSANIQSWVTNTGEGIDALNNAAWFNGDWRETISSHTGRYYTAKYGNTYLNLPASQPDLVIPFKFKLVKWITDKFQPDHVLKSVEQPFLNQPL